MREISDIYRDFNEVYKEVLWENPPLEVVFKLCLMYKGIGTGQLSFFFGGRYYVVQGEGGGAHTLYINGTPTKVRGKCIDVLFETLDICTKEYRRFKIRRRRK